MKKMLHVTAADDEPTYYVDELGEEAYLKALRDESVRDLLFDTAYDMYEDGLKSIRKFLESVYCKFSESSDFDPTYYVVFDVELTPYGEDVFRPEALDPYSGHMEEVPEAESDGFYTGEECKDTWNDKVRPVLQEKFNAVNDKSDAWYEQHEDDEDQQELIWSEYGPLYDDMQTLKDEYVRQASTVVESVLDDMVIEFNDFFESTERQTDMLNANEIKFTADGERVFD